MHTFVLEGHPRSSETAYPATSKAYMERPCGPARSKGFNGPPEDYLTDVRNSRLLEVKLCTPVGIARRPVVRPIEPWAGAPWP
jgi:hypothetical protein